MLPSFAGLFDVFNNVGSAAECNMEGCCPSLYI